MTSYAQFCPVAKAAEILGERWTILILRELTFGSTRFSELRKGLPRISPTLLAERLRKLETAGVIRHVASGTGETAEYRLTEAGERVAPMIHALAEWGHRFIPDRHQPGDLDPRFLMWAIRRNIRPDHLPGERCVIRVELFDAPRAWRFWWLLAEHGEVDLCIKDPGYEVAVDIRSAMLTLTRLFDAKIGLSTARHSGTFRISGRPDLIGTMDRWFGRPAARRFENAPSLIG